VASRVVALPASAHAARAPRPRAAGAFSTLTLAAISLVGVAAFLYPFLLSKVDQGNEGVARAQDAPLIFGVVLSMALLLFVMELTRRGVNAKSASMLAVVMVAAAALRIPTLPAGASAFYFLVIVGGYVFGARLGFLLGAGALFVSAFAVGGFGPWLPFQTFAAGWLGLSAGWLGTLLQARLREHKRLELIVLATFAALWGFLFGAIMNLWFWPFVAQGESISWAPGMGLGEALRHYWAFYVLTSAGWDAWRAIANVAFVVVAGRPTIDLLVRYRDRFQIKLA
jgi:energy-coupling factor transport system substrate-specific component